MSILVIGAHGKVASRALPLLKKLDNNVVGIVRKADDESDLREAGVTPVVADITTLSPEKWRELLHGHSTIVFSAGAGGGNPERTYAVDRDAAIAAIDACPTESHFIMVSYWGALRGDEVPESEPFHHYARSKMLADAHLRASTKKYTILKPAALTDDEAGEIRRGVEDERNPGTTSREAVAMTIARVAAEGPSGDYCFVDND